MLAILNYGVGNLASIQNMFKRLGVNAVITDREDDVLNASKFILPGVGSFDYGMGQLRGIGFLKALQQRVLIDKIPILGICLGVQLMTEGSDEGSSSGLGWIKGRTVSFDRTRLPGSLKIPHMGWSDVHDYQSSQLFKGLEEDARFYFVHSYHLQVENPSDVLVKVTYGYTFAAGVERENILGVQFHPEKSHKYGLKIFENFIKHY